MRDEAAVLAAPESILDRDVRLTIDANRSAPVRLTVPDRDATGVLATIDYYFGADAAYSFGMFSDNYDGFRSGQIGAAVAVERFVASFAAEWADAEAASSRYLYAVAAAVPGRMPTGFVRDYRRRDLAVVVQEFAASGGGLLAERSVFADVGYNTGGWASAADRYARPAGGVRQHRRRALGLLHRIRHAGAGPALAGRPGRQPAGVRRAVPAAGSTATGGTPRR